MKYKITSIFKIKAAGLMNLFLWSAIISFFIMQDKSGGGINREFVFTFIYIFVSMIVLNALLYFLFRFVTGYFKNSALVSYLISNIIVSLLFVINYIIVLVFGKQLGLEGFVMTLRGWQGGELGDFSFLVLKFLATVSFYLLLFYLCFMFLNRILKGRVLNINYTAPVFLFFIITAVLLHFQLVSLASDGWKMSIMKQKIPWQSVTGFPEDQIKIGAENSSSGKFPELFKAPPMLSEKTETEQILNLKKNYDHIISHDFKAEKKYNILFINVEGLRSDMLNPSYAPHLYKFAKEKGIKLRNHYTTGNNTPGGLYGMLTGLSSFYHEPLRENGCRNLPLEVLKKLGYRQSIYYNSPKNYEYIYRDILENTEGKFVRIPGAIDDYALREQQLVDNYLDELKNDRSGIPRFDYYLFNVTHFNYYYPPEFEKFKPAFTMQFQIISGKQEKFEKHKEGLMNRYKNSIYYFDSLINQVLVSLEKMGRLNNTIVVIAGDHGEEFWEHGSFGHTWGLNNKQIQTTSILYYPGAKQGAVKYKYTSHQDFLPTVFDLIKLNYNTGVFMTGKSLLKYDADRDYAISSLGVLVSFKRNDYAIIGDGYKILFKNNKDLNSSPYAVYYDNDKPVEKIDTYKAINLLLKTKRSKNLVSPGM
ncbi:MAG: sulfatase-like hydrolase/transferase [Spirochaetota bacterium]